MPPASDAVQAARRLIHDEWELRLQLDPLAATLAGDHRYDDRLPAVSEAEAGDRLARLRGLRERGRALPRETLAGADGLNLDLLLRFLDDEIAELGFHAYRMPLARHGGFHSSLAELPDIMPFGTAQDYENYLARLRAIPGYIAGQLAVMRAGLCEGQVPGRATLAGIAGSLRQHFAGDPAQTTFFDPFRRFPPTLDPAAQARLAEAGRAVIESAVLPAFQTLIAFLTGEYEPAARPTPAVGELPDGAAFYAHRVRLFTTLDVTPEQVHATGLAEVQRLRAEMDAILGRLQFAGSFADFLGFLRSDPRFYAETPEALMKEVALVLKRMDGELPKLFRTLPRTPYGLKPIPDHLAPHTYSAYYFPPAGDGTRAGIYFINTYDLKSRPLYEIEALSFHEAVPGHHLQIALQQEIAGLPAFRRFGSFTAFVEGWALYAERLGLEVGFYQDPYRDFGRLTYEIWRACRLVVDTGLHAFGWTRPQAIDFMLANTALSRLNIENEVDRYSAWPGQALAYKMGELKIRELRGLAERQLGARFDRRAFHDWVLLDGPLPLAVLEARVREHIAQQSA